MHSSRKRRQRRSQPLLRLPSKRYVNYFREKRLLTHLHEQLLEQLTQNPHDWQLHFQLANLLAFNDDSFYSNKNVDIMHAATHYQKSLKLLKQTHEQNYAIYQNNRSIFDSLHVHTPVTPIVYEDEEESKCAQPIAISFTISPQLLGENTRHKKRSNKPETDSQKQRRKRCSNKERTRNKNSSNKRKKPKKIKISAPKQAKRLKKQRKLLIAIRNDDNEVSQEINCQYSSHMSSEEIAMEYEKNNQNQSKKRTFRTKVTAKYLSAVARSNEAFRPSARRKRPSIIMMFDPGSPQNNGGKDPTLSFSAPNLHKRKYSTDSPISIVQSESETVTESIMDEYSVPAQINKGYTQCFFGYGKYLSQNGRRTEGIHNLLECASWYNDSFVDPSCLTSLVLPPQFLFEDSVKKRHCINFRTLTKYISKLMSEELKGLDKRFKKLNMAKYISEYQTYLCEFEEEMEKNMKIVVDGIGLTPNGKSNSAGTNTTDSPMSITNIPALEYGLSNVSSVGNVFGFNGVSDLTLNTGNIDGIQSDLVLLSPDVFSPDLSSNVSNLSYQSNISYSERDTKNLINYCVYPQIVQDLVSEYTNLCSYCHRLGLLLTDFMRFSDAKREFGRALGIFRKLKIKNGLYDEVLSDMKMTQNNSVRSPSHQERAQMLASKPKSTRAPVSPSFDFSFDERFQFTFKAK